MLLSYARQVALGMSCLLQKSYIHRDLAARNILVSECGMICKVKQVGKWKMQQSLEPHQWRPGLLHVSLFCSLNTLAHSFATVLFWPPLGPIVCDQNIAHGYHSVLLCGITFHATWCVLLELIHGVYLAPLLWLRTTYVQQGVLSKPCTVEPRRTALA